MSVQGSGTQPIAALIPMVVQRAEQQHRALFAIQRRWGRLVGNALAAHTRPLSLRRGRLVVAADRPGDGHALSYQRAQLLERLRASGTGAVEEVVIRPGARARGGRCPT